MLMVSITKDKRPQQYPVDPELLFKEEETAAVVLVQTP
jgi:hypothetical protein